ncbi:MAG TPA: hypothetical protein VIH59_15045 [Candidatus Tectomicrobia bacterium]|jgi:hypothetical protein
MQRTLTLIVALSMAVVFGGATLAGADCTYHKSQASVDKADPSKTVATAPETNKTDANQLQTAQSEQPARPAPAVKK